MNESKKIKKMKLTSFSRYQHKHKMREKMKNKRMLRYYRSVYTESHQTGKKSF